MVAFFLALQTACFSGGTDSPSPPPLETSETSSENEEKTQKAEEESPIRATPLKTLLTK